MASTRRRRSSSRIDTWCAAATQCDQLKLIMWTQGLVTSLTGGRRVMVRFKPRPAVPPYSEACARQALPGEAAHGGYREARKAASPRAPRAGMAQVPGKPPAPAARPANRAGGSGSASARPGATPSSAGSIVPRCGPSMPATGSTAASALASAAICPMALRGSPRTRLTGCFRTRYAWVRVVTEAADRVAPGSLTLSQSDTQPVNIGACYLRCLLSCANLLSLISSGGGGSDPMSFSSLTLPGVRFSKQTEWDTKEGLRQGARIYG